MFHRILDLCTHFSFIWRCCFAGVMLDANIQKPELVNGVSKNRLIHIQKKNTLEELLLLKALKINGKKKKKPVNTSKTNLAKELLSSNDEHNFMVNRNSTHNSKKITDQMDLNWTRAESIKNKPNESPFKCNFLVFVKVLASAELGHYLMICEKKSGFTLEFRSPTAHTYTSKIACIAG